MPVDLPFLHQVRDLLQQVRLVDLVGDLGDDQRHLAAASLLGARLGAHADEAASRGVAVADALEPVDHGAGREVRPLDVLHDVVEVALGLVDDQRDGVGDLGQVVRRDLGGHADGDARRAVDQQVGHDRGEDHRLLQRLVVVGAREDGVLLQVAQHLHRQRRQARLGVTHGRRRVAVDRAVVALAVDQRVAHVEVLRHAHQRRVDDLLAVGMVVARSVAGDLGALAVRAPRGEAQVVHGDQDAALRRLQAVAAVGQRARHDDRHRVVEIRRLHFLFEEDARDLLAVQLAHASVLPAIRCRDSSRTSRFPR